MDIIHYSKYYSYEELNERINNINLTIDIFNKLNCNQLFDIAIKNGIIDLAEYLYINCDIEYELSELLNMNTKTFITETQINELSIPQYTSTGGNNGIKLDISGCDKRINIIISKLIKLRKYSIMRSYNKKFYYKFNKKYIDRFEVSYM
jgi:hypothetical protein